jgi:hypothetical protein
MSGEIKKDQAMREPVKKEADCVKPKWPNNKDLIII